MEAIADARGLSHNLSSPPRHVHEPGLDSNLDIGPRAVLYFLVQVCSGHHERIANLDAPVGKLSIGQL